MATQTLKSELTEFWQVLGPVKGGKGARQWRIQCLKCRRTTTTTTSRWNSDTVKKCECQQTSKPKAPKERRKVLTITHNGHTRTLREWADYLNVPFSTLYYRSSLSERYPTAESVLYGTLPENDCPVPLIEEDSRDLEPEIDKTIRLLTRAVEEEMAPILKDVMTNIILNKVKPFLRRAYDIKLEGKPARPPTPLPLAEDQPESVRMGPDHPRWNTNFLVECTFAQAYELLLHDDDLCLSHDDILAELGNWLVEEPMNVTFEQWRASVYAKPEPKPAPEPKPYTPPRTLPCPQNSSVLPEFFEYRQVELDLDKMPDWWASEEQADPEALNRFLHLPWIEENPLIYKIRDPLDQFPWMTRAPDLLPRPYIRYAACAWDRGIVLQHEQDFPRLERYVQNPELPSIQDVNEYYSFVYLAYGLYNWGGQTFLWNKHPDRDTADILYAICEDIARWYQREPLQQLACHAAYLLNRQCIYLDHWKRTRDFSFQKNLVRNKDFILGEGFVSCVMAYLPNLQELIGEMDADHFVDKAGKRVFLLNHWDPMTQKN